MKWSHEQAISYQNFMSKIARTYSSRRICDRRVMILRIRIRCELELEHFVRRLTRVSPLIRIKDWFSDLPTNACKHRPKFIQKVIISDVITYDHHRGSGMYFTGFKYQRMINHDENHIAFYKSTKERWWMGCVPTHLVLFYFSCKPEIMYNLGATKPSR